MNPVHAISDILEHALVGHEKVAIFEASLTTTEIVQNDVNIRLCMTWNSEGQKCQGLSVSPRTVWLSRQKSF